MAGASNIFNTDAHEALLEAVCRSNAIELRREHVELTIVSQDAQYTIVSLTPKIHDGMSPYVDPVQLRIRKLNLNGKLPKDMCYSGNWPLDLEGLATFFSSSYGLELRAGEWTIRQNGTEVVLDESYYSNGSYQAERMFYLKPSTQHPLLEAGSFELPVMITEPLVIST